MATNTTTGLRSLLMRRPVWVLALVLIASLALAAGATVSANGGKPSTSDCKTTFSKTFSKSSSTSCTTVTKTPTPTPTPRPPKAIETKQTVGYDSVSPDEICESDTTGEWHFVITQVVNQAAAPASIHVKFDDGSEHDLTLDKFTGGTAHYRHTGNLDDTLVSATATIYGDWGGQFNVSHTPCMPEPEDECDDDGDDNSHSWFKSWRSPLTTGGSGGDDDDDDDDCNNPCEGDNDDQNKDDDDDDDDNSHSWFKSWHSPLTTGGGWGGDDDDDDDDEDDNCNNPCEGEDDDQNKDDDDDDRYGYFKARYSPLTGGTHGGYGGYGDDDDDDEDDEDDDDNGGSCKTDTTTVTAIHKDGGDHTTDIQNTTQALGTSVHDSAVVTAVPGPATGTVNFKFFASLDCTGNAVWSEDKAIGVESSSTGALAAGSYSFLATYSGDANYNGSMAACEPIRIGQAGSSTSTTLHNSDETVMLIDINGVGHSSTGNADDKATVTGVVGFPPTGNVSFTFFTNLACTAGTGAAAGTVALVAGVAHPSTATGALAVGSYAFQATYAGDGNYTGSTSACEPFQVTTIKFYKNLTAASPVGGITFYFQALGGPMPVNASVLIPAGGYSGSGSTSYLAPGLYQVNEYPVPANWKVGNLWCQSVGYPTVYDSAAGIGGDADTDGIPPDTDIDKVISLTVPGGTHWDCIFNNDPATG